MPSGGLGSRLSTWLLRPYLDLGPLREGPLHARCVEACWAALDDPACPPFIAQRAMPDGFRGQLGAEAGPAYGLHDPRALPHDLRTDRWTSLCGTLDNWNACAGETQCRAASMLHSMCLYRPLLALIPADAIDWRRADPHGVTLAFWRASARFMLDLSGRTARYGATEMQAFEDIALHAGNLAPVGFNATAMVFVRKAKTRADIDELRVWATRLEEALAANVRGLGAFDAAMLTSRFHRATAFLPQRRGDKAETVRVMTLAEDAARSSAPSTPAQDILFRENIHAVMESRTKEAVWLGDMDEAIARSRKVLEVDPCDSKAWVELGQLYFRRQDWHEASRAYAVAAMLGPPASAIGRHMVGACLRALGHDHLAALHFKDTLEIDPLGVSPRMEIRALPDTAALGALKAWCTDTTSA